MPRIRIILAAVLSVALLACAYVGFTRFQREAAASRVEIAMDWGDFNGFARSYDYNSRQMLVELRRAGLTSLAVSEELGSAINSGREASVISGQSLLAQARLGTIKDPTLAALLAAKKIDPDTVYLTIFTNEAKTRYLAQLAMHFNRRSITILRKQVPYLVAVHTQLDYLSGLGLGLPSEPLGIARDLGLYLMPRLQNDERFGADRINEEFRRFLAHERVSTVVFFGIRNEVLGFPDHLSDAADAFRRTHLNYGSIETYDTSQIQKGNEGLAHGLVGQIVRVQAISKPELDKLDFETVVARYLLGARERNVRVIYVRPLLHQYNNMSMQQTNIELIRRIREGLADNNLTLGRATPISAFRTNPVVLGIATLGTPAAIFLALELLGVAFPLALFIAACVLDLLIFGAAFAVHREATAAKLIALPGAVAFVELALIALAERFRRPDMPTSLPHALGAGIVSAVTGTVVALGGALLIVGLVSNPLTMTEIERFTGVKTILLAPPLVALAAWIATRRFRDRALRWSEIMRSPVRFYQVLVGLVLLVAGIVYLVRSGNQNDIAPSTLELALRSKLTLLLSVRPRFKEFLIGVPFMMLLAVAAPLHRRQLGWLFALAIAVGLADTVDTFSHLHTPLVISLLRVVNGLVVGIVIGALAIVIYRRLPLTASYLDVVSEEDEVVEAAPVIRELPA